MNEDRTQNQNCVICGKYAGLTEIHCITGNDDEHTVFEEVDLASEYPGPTVRLCPTHHVLLHKMLENTERPEVQDVLIVGLTRDELKGLENVLQMEMDVAAADLAHVDQRIAELEASKQGGDRGVAQTCHRDM